MRGAVIGREGELAAIGGFLDSVWCGPRALVFAGEPGIGKTLLWEAGVARAKERAGRVLSCRGAEAEASLSFAALSELVGPVFDEVSESLAAPRRRALAVALLLAEPVEERPDAHAIGLGVLDALRVLAADAPVVVAGRCAVARSCLSRRARGRAAASRRRPRGCAGDRPHRFPARGAAGTLADVSGWAA